MYSLGKNSTSPKSHKSSRKSSPKSHKSSRSSRKSSRSPKGSGNLLKAIEYKALYEFEEILEKEDPNQSNEVGLTALMIAVNLLFVRNAYDPESDYRLVYTFVQKLLNKGANANAVDQNNNTALLHFLIIKHDNSPSAKKLFDLLLKSTDTVNIQRTSDGDTALMKAIENGASNEWEFVEPLLETSDCALLNKYGQSAMKVLIQTYTEDYEGRTDIRPEIAQKLIDCGENVNRIDKDALSYIDYAVIYGIYPLIEVFILNDAILTETAEEEMDDTDDPQLQTLYDQAKERERILSTEIESSESAFYAACFRGSEAKVKEFLKTPIDVNMLTGGKTPLMIAAARKHSRIVELLLDHPGIQVNIQDLQGYTALHYAVIARDIASVKHLLKANADRTLQNVHGLRAFHCTRMNEIRNLLAIPFSIELPLQIYTNLKDTVASNVFKEFPTFDPSVVLEALQSKELCYTLSIDYVKKSLNSCDIALVITHASEVMGICFMNIGDTLYIDIFCTNPQYRGVGSYMMNMIKRFATQLGNLDITLCSVSSAVGFYEKVQFGKYMTDSCGSSLIPMRYTAKGGRYRKRRTVRMRRKAASLNQVFP